MAPPSHSAAQTAATDASASAAVLQMETPASVRSSAPDQDPFKYLLMLRFALFNLVAFALLGMGWSQGWIDQVVRADQTGLSVAIFAVFAVGLGLSATKVWRVSAELNCLRDATACKGTWAKSYLREIRGRSAGSRAIIASALRATVFGRIAVVRTIANSLVLLGLIGTVLGFIIALSGVDPEAASDVSAVSPMVSRLLGGMSVALYTTLVGAVLNLWLVVNYHLLSAGTVVLVAKLIGLGETHARS